MHINDYYEPGFEFIQLDTVDKSELKKIWKAKTLIKIRDLLCKYGLVTPGLLAAILFKGDPDPSLLKSLKKSGCIIKELPRNPYIV